VLRVLTFNIWNISAPFAPRMAELTAGLKSLAPDIVCLQEVSPDPRDGRLQSESLAEHCGFAHHRFSLTGHWENRNEGLAILSRHPIAGTAVAPLPEFPGDRARQVLFAKVVVETAAGSRPLLVANTHLAYAVNMTAERKAQVFALNRAIDEYRRRFDATSVVVCGDFNDQPPSPAIADMLAGGTRFDAFAACHPGADGHTFTSRNPHVDGARWPDWRVDYIFGEGELRPVDCRVVFDGETRGIASDHFGVLATLAFT
jgi:endonuclease/exonuclease/phosphatase family metal-dependent hydrolase